MYADRFWFLGLSRELGYLPSDADQRRAWLAIYKKTAIWSFVAALLLSQISADVIARTCPLPAWFPPVILHMLLALFFAGVFSGVGWLYRRRMVCALRAYLLAHGIPVCQHCGYLLRGLTEPRCPECGESFDLKLLDRRDAGS